MPFGKLPITGAVAFGLDRTLRFPPAVETVPVNPVVVGGTCGGVVTPLTQSLMPSAAAIAMREKFWSKRALSCALLKNPNSTSIAGALVELRTTKFPVLIPRSAKRPSALMRLSTLWAHARA